jgi:predicted nucleic acid-binding protein
MGLRGKSMFVLDTNLLIEIEKGNEKIISLIQGLISKYPCKPVITAPTYSEFMYGYLQSSNKEEKAKEFLEAYDLLQTTKNSSLLFAKLKYNLMKKGKAIPLFDILVASIVMDRNATLLTMDTHFKNIEELRTMIIES